LITTQARKEPSDEEFTAIQVKLGINQQRQGNSRGREGEEEVEEEEEEEEAVKVESGKLWCLTP
jgi:hypothetical protein